MGVTTKVLDFRNPPTGWYIDIGSGTGNVQSWSDVRQGYYMRQYSGNVNTPLYEPGDIVEIALNLDSLTSGRYMTMYAQGMSLGSSGEAYGYWAITEMGGATYRSGTAEAGNQVIRIDVNASTYVRWVCIRETNSISIIGSSTSSSGASSASTGQITWKYIYGNMPVDPYSQLDIPTSTTGGGPNSPSNPVGYDGITSDPIDFPELQTFSVSDAGFMSIWCPTLSQLQDLSYFLWNADPLTVEFWKRIVSSPLEMILGLMIIPYSVPSEDLHENGDVYLGYKKSGIKMNYTTKQFVSVDCGSIDIKEVWGAFLDYSPYTKISIYLPYIGVHDLDTDEVMDKTITLKYFIDLCTGSCVAVLKCGDSCLYTFNGNCAVQIPVTTAQHADALKALLSIAGSSLQMAAVGGVAGAAAGAAIGGLTQLENIKPKVSHSGSLSATNGYMAPQTPYLIFSRPKQAQPEEQQKYTGYPSFITSLIGDLEGYSEIEIIHLHNMTCTEEELNEIDSLLSEGVII